MVLGGASILGGIGGAIGSSINARKAREELDKQNAIIDEQHAKNEAIFNKQYYQNITDRTEVQDMLRKLEENQRTQQKRNDAQTAITGATPEAQLASQNSLNKSYADAIAGIARNASTLKDGYLNNWQNQMNNYYAQRLGLSDKIAGSFTNESNQWGNMASNAFSTGATMLGNGLDSYLNAKGK